MNGSKTVPQYIKTEKLGEDGAKVLDGSCDGEQVIDFNFTGLTQYASPFSVAKLDQDGSTVGQLTGVEIASDANIDGHMLFGMTGRQCQTTIANGKLLMKDRELIGIDEEAVNAHILEEAKKLWGALNNETY